MYFATMRMNPIRAKNQQQVFQNMSDSMTQELLSTIVRLYPVSMDTTTWMLEVATHLIKSDFFVNMFISGKYPDQTV